MSSLQEFGTNNQEDVFDINFFDINYENFLNDLIIVPTKIGGNIMPPYNDELLNTTGSLNEAMKEAIRPTRIQKSPQRLIDLKEEIKNLHPPRVTDKVLYNNTAARTKGYLRRAMAIIPPATLSYPTVATITPAPLSYPTAVKIPPPFSPLSLPPPPASSSTSSSTSTSTSSSTSSSLPPPPSSFSTSSSSLSNEFETNIKSTSEIFITMISETDSLLSTEIDPKKILCNIHDWVILGTINTDFSTLLFDSVDKFIKVHIKKEQAKNPTFNSTILLTYLTSLQLKIEDAFLKLPDSAELTNLPYTELLKKLFGEEVGQQEKKQRDATTGVKQTVKNPKTGYTEFVAQSVREAFIAAVANQSQCESTIGAYGTNSRCWIVDENLTNYVAHAAKNGSNEDVCPADPGIDCEHIGGLRFQLIHSNVVQSGMKRYRKNLESYKPYIEMFYDWSFHGPNVIKNDDEWLEFNKDNSGFFNIVKDGKKFEFEKTLHKINLDANNKTNTYGCACINLVKSGKTKVADLSKVPQPPNVLRIANRLDNICRKMNKDLRQFYDCIPASSVTAYGTSSSGTSSSRTSSSTTARGSKSAGLTVEQQKILLGVNVYNYMCIFKFLSNIPTLEFTNMVTHTAYIRNIKEEEEKKLAPIATGTTSATGTKPKKGGKIETGGKVETGDKNQTGGGLNSYLTTINVNPAQEIYYNLGESKCAVFENLKQNQDETNKTIDILLYLRDNDIDTIIADTEMLEKIIRQNNRITLPSLIPDETNDTATRPPILLEEPIPLIEDESLASIDDRAINYAKTTVENNPPPSQREKDTATRELKSTYDIDANTPIRLDSPTKQTSESLDLILRDTTIMQNIRRYVETNIISRYTREQHLNYELYYYTIKYYCKFKNNMTKYIFNLEKRQIEASSRLILELDKRQIKPPITRLPKNNKPTESYIFKTSFGANSSKEPIFYDITFTIDLSTYSSREETPLNLIYIVSINKTGTQQPISTEEDVTIFCLNAKKNVIMINAELNGIKKSFMWTLEELKRKMGGKKNKNKTKTKKHRKTIKTRNKKNRKTIKYY